MPDTAENEALAHRWHMEIFQEGNLDVADRIVAPGFVFHLPGEDVHGIEGTKQLAAEWNRGFPGASINHEDAFSSGDKVAIRWTAEGTHRGKFLGVAATGTKVNMHGIDIYRIQEGKIAEAWIEWDVLGVLQQMGVVPLLPAQTTEAPS
jgi:steroid delta-isomerase-like uncharacterized protein